MAGQVDSYAGQRIVSSETLHVSMSVLLQLYQEEESHDHMPLDWSHSPDTLLICCIGSWCVFVQPVPYPFLFYPFRSNGHAIHLHGILCGILEGVGFEMVTEEYSLLNCCSG
jgi:hypothetical protein